MSVRLMTPEESTIIVDYFHGSPPEHLETLGVDPTRLPPQTAWREAIAQQLPLPIERRKNIFVAWLQEDRLIGFSTADKITFGEQAYMHLHIVHAKLRNNGAGTDCVRESVALYFSLLGLKRLFCEPNAFNVAPNRTLQRAGFKYLKTHMTVPGPLNFRQAVNRWVIEQ